MIDLLDRIEGHPGGGVLRGSGAGVDDLLRRLEAGEPPAAVAAASGLGAIDLIAALVFGALGEPEGPPLIQSKPRRPGLAKALTRDALEPLLPDSGRPELLALAAGLLQVHDFWAASHEAAQEADDLGEGKTAAYWHGVAHRREPDPGNAAYWFRRVGKHPLFQPLGAAARGLIRGHDGPVPADAERLIRGGSWDPMAMIELGRAARPGSPAESLARRLQRIELAALLAASAGNAGAG